MFPVQERVEGYKIVTELEGKVGSIGAEGNESSWPAFSWDAVIQYLTELPEASEVTYTIRKIDGARYVRSASGKVVDNGESTAKTST